MGSKLKRIRFSVFICLLFVTVGWCSAEKVKEPVTGVLGAFDLELNVLRKEVVDQKTETIMGLKFVTGTLKGRKIVFAETGVGKVHAAIATTILIDHFAPSEVIFTGVAGGINPELSGGDIVIGEKTAQHDLIILKPDSADPYKVPNPVTGKPYPDFYNADAILLGLARQAAKEVQFDKIGSGDNARTPKVITGVIVSGDMFLSESKKKNQLRRDYKADAIEMEGAVVAQICYQQDIRCVVIRSVSDGADENADNDFEKYVATAADNAAKIVVKMFELMASDPEFLDTQENKQAVCRMLGARSFDIKQTPEQKRVGIVTNYKIINDNITVYDNGLCVWTYGILPVSGEMTSENGIIKEMLPEAIQKSLPKALKKSRNVEIEDGVPLLRYGSADSSTMWPEELLDFFTFLNETYEKRKNN